VSCYQNEVSVKANANNIGDVMPKLKPPVSVKANACFIGLMPELKPPISVKAHASPIGIKRSSRN
jgi:hypothetical protein